MKRLVVVALAALLAWLSFGIQSAAVATSSSPTAHYAYDSRPAPTPPQASVSERGPPATYAYSALRLAVDTSSHGSAACPQPGSTWAYDVYDRPVEFAHSDRARVTTPARSGGSVADVRVVPDVRCAAKAGTAGADDVLNGLRLHAQLTGQEIAGGHAFEKHILDLGEFPGIRTRAQFASHIEDVVMNGQMRNLGGGRTAFWRDGTVVIRNPRAPDGGTAFQPHDGYDYFLNQLH